jgi:FkbM family methyltransferase
LHLKGAGALLRILTPYLRGLHRFPMTLPEGQTIHVDFRDISAFYWLNGLLGERFEEEGLLASIVSVTDENSVIWDVGANGGLFSYYLAKRALHKNIVFFEPNPMMYSLAMSALQAFPSVQGCPYALSDRSGAASLVVPEGGSTIGTLEAARTERSGTATPIECRTGDELIEDQILPPPHVIKIDTEGHEVCVVHGLIRSMRALKPKIFFEHISISDSEALGLVPEGYKLYSVSDEDGSLEEGFNRKRGHNSALIPQV